MNQYHKLFSTKITNKKIIQSIKVNKKYYISKSSGRDLIKINSIDWAQKVEDYGAGEIILTSVNNEGLKKGFDIDLTNKVSEKVNIPVIAHGGAGSFEDIYKVIKHTNISGVGLASILHYEALNYFPRLKPKVGNISFLHNFNKVKKKRNLISEIKNYLKSKKVKVRSE